MIESGRVPGKGRIRGSIDKLSWGVPEKGLICVSTENGRIRGSIEKLSLRVPEIGRICVSTEKLYNPGEYREKLQPVRVSKNFPDEYRKKVESV